MWAFVVGALLLFGATSELSAQDSEEPPSTGGAAADEEARVHFRLGTAYYDSGRFAQAAQEFKQAYELSKRAPLLYNLFLAYRDAGDVQNAAAALRQYLADNPEVDERSKLEARLAALERIIQGQPAPQPQPAQPDPNATNQPPAQTAAAQPTETKPETQEPDKLKWLPWTLIGAGGALVVASVITGALAKSDESQLEKMCPKDACPPDRLGEAEDLKSSGAMKATLTDALWISGAVAAGVGVAFVFWKPWRKGSESPTMPVNVSCGTRGCGASWTGHF